AAAPPTPEPRRHAAAAASPGPSVAAKAKRESSVDDLLEGTLDRRMSRDIPVESAPRPRAGGRPVARALAVPPPAAPSPANEIRGGAALQGELGEIVALLRQRNSGAALARARAWRDRD